MKGLANATNTQGRGKSGSAACRAESLWLSGADSVPSSPRVGWKAEPSSRPEGVRQGGSPRKGEAFPHSRRQSRFGMLRCGDLTRPCTTTARPRILRSEKVLSYNVSIAGILDVVLLRGLLIIGLIGLNAFFAATEYALLSVRRTRIEQLVRGGDPRARAVQVLLADIGSLISGTQLGVTVVSVLMGWLGEGFIAAGLQHLFTGLRGHASLVVVHSIASACAFVLITIFLMVLGELVPKAVAYDHAEMVSLAVARPMLFFLKLSHYAVEALVGMANGVLGALGRSPLRGVRPLPTPEEVKLIVSSIRKHGLLREEQEDIIDTVFDLDRILVREVMVPWTRITCLPLTQDLKLLLDRIVKDQHSRLPIYEGSPDHVVGILYTKDLLRVVSERLKSGVPLQAPMDLRPILRQPMIVPEAKPLSQVLEEARKHHSHLALVV